MNVIIVGAGVVGTTLAEQLSGEGHRVSVVDSNRARIREVEQKLDVLAVCGDAGRLSLLEKVGIREAEMCIAVTNVDEVNLVVGMMASRLGVAHCIVRIRNPEYADEHVLNPRELGIDRIINPEPAIVDSLLYMIQIPGSNEVETLADGQILTIAFDVGEDSPAAGHSLAELRALGDLNAFLILYISRGDEVIIPRGDDTIRAGDNIHVLVSADTVDFLVPMIHRHPPTVSRVIISGAGRIAIQVATALEQQSLRVFLIEPDAAAAEEAAAKLDRTIVLRGDATDLAVLEEAAIDNCDLFFAISEDDQSNMLAALLAKKHGARKTAVVVQRPEYVPVLDSLGIEIVINPRLVTIGEIMAQVRRGQVQKVRRMSDSEAEIIELDAAHDCPAVQAPLQQLKFPRNALVGAIVRDGVMLIPTGETQIQPGETVVVYALPEAIARIEKLFTKK